MALTIKTIKKRSTFNLMREKGLFVKGESMNLQFLPNGSPVSGGSIEVNNITLNVQSETGKCILN